jgi:4-hydroxy-tetrahydrodipicolinate synthase
LFPERLLKLIESKQDDPQLVELVKEVLKFPVTPAVKALLAHRQNDPAWLNVRAPLVALTEKEVVHLADAYHRIFEKKGS